MASLKKANLTVEPHPAQINAIFAMDEKGGIGLNNKLPWTSISPDLFRFKRLTSGHVVIMGKNTWLGLPNRPLPGRTNVILTSDNSFGSNESIWPTLSASGSLDVLNDLLGSRYPYSSIWYIGGANVLYQAAPYIEQLWITRIPGEFNCDTVIDLERLMGVGKADYELIYTEYDQEFKTSYEVWQRSK